ncbi:MAG: dTDP-4-dehydrorhamnose reductase [Verrucomicrobiales bacterium]|nr:dTDP-4-dehydrorhamnose reductase [Verrucomicrobiota bacterium JB025]
MSAQHQILVIGGGGQLSTSLQEAAADFPEFELHVPDMHETDITDAGSVKAAFEKFRPALVVNAAAHTAVDKAESEEGVAFAINALGPYLLALECAAAGVPLYHISTDYVFDGEGDRPWREDDLVGPLGAYGRTKLAGEWAVAATHGDSLVFRTSWVFSPFGNNFVKTMLRLAEDRDELTIVGDQHGCPTYAPDLAKALLEAARGRLVGGEKRAGVYHFCNQGPTSWFEFAQAIFAKGVEFGFKQPEVRAIPTSDYPTPAKRPAWSVLDLERTRRDFGFKIPQWDDALDRCLARLAAERDS